MINPASGRRRDLGRLRKTIEARCSRAGLDFTTRICDEVGELDSILRQAAGDGTDVVVAVGGDGTVHEIGTRLIDSPLALGILPVGSGNGLARHLGVSIDPVGALDGIASSRIETIDTARAALRPFLGVAGVGFDAAVAHRFGLRGRRGLLAYAEEAMWLLRGYRPERYEVKVDGEPIETTALLVAVANSSQYGNQARIAPAASLADGQLDLCILEQPPLLAVPILLRKLFAGTLRDGAGVVIRRGRSITVVRSGEGPAHLDGEPLTMPARIEFEIRPRSLRVLVPAGRRVI